jgi:hypothetical protein
VLGNCDGDQADGCIANAIWAGGALRIAAMSPRACLLVVACIRARPGRHSISASLLPCSNQVKIAPTASRRSAPRMQRTTFSGRVDHPATA